MNFTLFGYPKTGKTTLFNLLTGAQIQVKAYDEGKKEPNLRSCAIPDSRLDKLSSLYPQKEKKPIIVDYIDLAGVSYGEIKNEAYLDYLRKADGLTHVVREFKEKQIPYPGKISPGEDILSMEEELILADLISIDSRLEKLEKELKRTKSAEGEKEKESLSRIRKALEEKRAIRELDLSSDEEKRLRHFSFLSQKPLIHMINVDEENISLLQTPGSFHSPSPGTTVLGFCGKVEMEILELQEKEKHTFLKEYGLQEFSAPRFLKSSYELLQVITFFTIGKKEVKAWTIKENTPALKAAGAVHTDMEKGFIKAEVISWEDLIKFRSFQKAREQAAVRLEGKDYIVQDGDVIFFRFSK
ncbi:YchF family ATPase [bacterium]|nr:YchF family ATPase [bacterium]